jgi:hypothetical protein
MIPVAERGAAIRALARGSRPASAGLHMGRTRDGPPNSGVLAPELLRQLERIPDGLLGGRIGSGRAADPDNRWALSFNTCLFTHMSQV